MIISHNQNYNPKIDFLICKNLIYELPQNHDEHSLKKCFKGEIDASQWFEEKIVKIKSYFLKHDICSFTNQNVQDLYFIIMDEKIDLGNKNLYVEKLDDVIAVAKYVGKFNIADKNTLFKLMILKGYCKGENVPIIPYSKLCWKIYASIITENYVMTSSLWERLLTKIYKYCSKHDLIENVNAVKQVVKYKDDFLLYSGAKALYLCGSLAVGQGNEYSDLDILAVYADETDLYKERIKAQEYWADKLTIPYDMLTSTENGWAETLQPAMKRTLVKIGGV